MISNMLAAANHPCFPDNAFGSTIAQLPLSPCSASARLRQQAMSNASKPHTPMSKRPIKPNPLFRSKEGSRDRRRELFLKRVQDDRDAQRWATRGDQILRLDYESERKRWEAGLAETAPVPEEPPEEEEEADLPAYSSQISMFRSQTTLGANQPPSDDAREADDIQRQEDEDLEALLALMETEEQKERSAQARDSQRYGSDDEDYDSIFRDLMGAGAEQAKRSAPEDEAMDTSNG